MRGKKKHGGKRGNMKHSWKLCCLTGCDRQYCPYFVNQLYDTTYMWQGNIHEQYHFAVQTDGTLHATDFVLIADLTWL